MDETTNFRANRMRFRGRIRNFKPKIPETPSRSLSIPAIFLPPPPPQIRFPKSPRLSRFQSRKFSPPPGSFKRFFPPRSNHSAPPREITKPISDQSNLAAPSMEIAGDAVASGGRSIRDLPPLKRFKFVGSNPGSAPCLPLPAKKRGLPPLPEAAPAPACLPAKKRAYAPPLDAVSPACLPAKKRVHVRPPPPEGNAPPPSVSSKKPPLVPVKKLVEVPPLHERVVNAIPSVPAKKRVQAPSPPEYAAAPPPVSVKNQVQMPPRPGSVVAATPAVPAKKRVQAPSPLEHAAPAPAVPVKKRVHAPSPLGYAAAPVAVPAKQRVLVPSCPEGVAAAPSVQANKRVPWQSPPEDASALAPVCLPANKRVMSQFIPPSSSPSMKSDGARVGAVKEVCPQGFVESGAATYPKVANGAEASKMINKPDEVKDQVFQKSRRTNTAKRASDLHCKKLSDVISGMQSEVQAEELKKFEQASDLHCKKLSEVVASMQSEVHAAEPKKFEQTSDLHCKKLPDAVTGTQSEVQAEDLKKFEQTLSDVVGSMQSEVQAEDLKKFEQTSDLRCKKPSDAVNDTQSEVQAEALKKFEQTSDLHCKKLSNVENGEQSEAQAEVLEKFEQTTYLHCKKPSNVVDDEQCQVQAEALKKFDRAIDPEMAAPASEKEHMKEDEEVATERKQDALAEEEEDGILCAVCRSTDGDPSDPIVFCDGCDLMVHATCYGNPLAQSIPDGDWFCSLCSAGAAGKKGKPARPPCRLCPARGGAMKRTTDGAWAHIACALLVPEVFFRDPDGREAIDCSLVPGRRFTRRCYICESSRGCALECSQPRCDLGFHVSCGLSGGLCIEYREEKGGGVVAGFCREHTKLWEKQQLTGKYKIVSRGQQ
ncbi:titin-like [Triticum dicoccoides]|uniref:titin-like n=1 Tax=Triticum dicoccoides TaxID=85692 RepID=UPI00188F7B83|nr:titin-like [Triticum dicoccoides]